MTQPATRADFKAKCLRNLGNDVIQINVSDDQSEDAIDDALYVYQQRHYNATERRLYAVQVTDADKTNKYFTLPDEIIGINDILDYGDSNASSSSSLFNVRYQLHLNDLYDFSSASFTSYVVAKRHIETIEELFVGKAQFRFTRHQHRLYIDQDWTTVTTGHYFIIDCYSILDPDTFVDIYSDHWLQQYATAKIKEKWGENLSKFTGMQMPGGIQFDGVRILQEARDRIDILEQQLKEEFEEPPQFFWG